MPVTRGAYKPDGDVILQARRAAPPGADEEGFMGLDKTPDLALIEERARERWEETGIYRFDPDAPGEIFSIDTPPPYVSAAHLHVGHAMSYAQAEFIIRYQRMRGRNVFYPMGFDDNGLPDRALRRADVRRSTRPARPGRSSARCASRRRRRSPSATSASGASSGSRSTGG